MAEAQIGQEKWKSARDFATTTTQVSVVLFAALIASWVGMWDHLNQYRGAAASREGIERQHRIAQEREQAVLKEAIRGRLLSDVLAIHGKPEAEQKARREEFLKLVTAKDFDPELTLRSLSKGDWKASLLSSAINTERVRLYRERLSAIAQFERRRAPAEKTSFKLLGLEFSVNGFWSWIVWMLFFCGGLVYLSLSRRALIRRCRSTWSVLSDEAKLPDEHLRSMAETLPVWARPLPQAEPWVEVLTNRPRLDAVLDPMSMLCVALMIACTGLVILVAWIGIISTSLLGGAKNVLLEPTLHAAMLCILCGLMVGILLGWGAVPNDHRRFWFRRKRRDADTVEVFGRRTWMMAIVGIGMGALAYSTCINKALVYLLLRRPRFRKSTSRRHPGPSTRANEPGRLKTGFYLDSRQRIHYVPESGRAHSLLGQVESGLQPWSGPFNSISLGRVHPRALIPFLREAVKTKTRGLQHRKDAAQRAKLIGRPAAQRRYRDAFELVRMGIARDEQGRQNRGVLPNLQLYDLLGAIAINANSKQLLIEARQALKSATLHAPNELHHQGNIPPSPEAGSSKHSRHSGRKRKPNFLARRSERLHSFRQQRLIALAQTGRPAEDLPARTPEPALEMQGLQLQFGNRRTHLPQGTWDASLLDQDTANAIHLVKYRKRQKRKRVHRKKL